jgi:hypothetical protein
MKKNKNDMVRSESLTSRTITRSGIIENGREMVVSCGYTHEGQFGYFVCWESQTPHKDNKIMHEYSDVISFKKKVNERTLYEVLADFRALVESFKNK